jgi:hypothetical protein
MRVLELMKLQRFWPDVNRRQMAENASTMNLRAHGQKRSKEHVCFYSDMALFCCTASRFHLRLRSKAAALSRPDSALLAIISDLLSCSQVSTWRATLQWAAQCAPAALSACGGAETCQGDEVTNLPHLEGWCYATKQSRNHALLKAQAHK